MDSGRFTVGWVCAHDFELTASRAMLDEEFSGEQLGFHRQLHPSDKNIYAYGMVGGHAVVMACAPGGLHNDASAANVARSMLSSFRFIRFSLMVGVGSGVPNDKHDIRLGDVVVSQPDDDGGGVTQYDFVGSSPNGSLHKLGISIRPPRVLLDAVPRIQSIHRFQGTKLPSHLEQFYGKLKQSSKSHFQKPDHNTDRLFHTKCQHGRDITCDSCGLFEETSRATRFKYGDVVDPDPHVHYGQIASGDLDVANMIGHHPSEAPPATVCIEREAAGLDISFPCLMIRGISDYADSHPRDGWHKYAASTAAAYAKDLLEVIPTGATNNTTSAGIERDHQDKFVEDLALCYHDDRTCIRNRLPGTFEWFLRDKKFLEWRRNAKPAILWLTAGPGFGKSVLSRSLLDENHLVNPDNNYVCYFFFKKNLAGRSTGANVISSILHQLFTGKGASMGLHSKLKQNYQELEPIEHLTELWDILIQCAKTLDSGWITCVIDGFDECEPDTRAKLQELLTDLYVNEQSVPRNDSVRLKLLVTSRPDPNTDTEFASMLPNTSYIDLDAGLYSDQVVGDIDKVAKSKIPQILGDMQPTDQKAFELSLKTLQNLSQLQLHLVFSIIKRDISVDVRNWERTLSTLPSAIEDKYGKLWEGIDASHQPRTRIILAIVLGAQRTLTIDETNIALAILEWGDSSGSDKDLQVRLLDEFDHILDHACAPFVQVVDSRVSLLHDTARDFLLQSSQGKHEIRGGSFDERKCHALLCKACIHRLMKATSLADQSDTFYQYAKDNWEKHWSLATLEFNDMLAFDAARMLTDVMADNHHKPYPQLQVTKSASRYIGALLHAAEMQAFSIYKCMLDQISQEPDSTACFEAIISQVVRNSKWQKDEDKQLLSMLLSKFQQMPDGGYLLDWVLQEALNTEPTGIMPLLLKSGAGLSLRTLRFAHALDNLCGNMHDSADMKDVLEGAYETENSQEYIFAPVVRIKTYLGEPHIPPESFTDVLDLSKIKLEFAWKVEGRYMKDFHASLSSDKMTVHLEMTGSKFGSATLPVSSCSRTNPWFPSQIQVAVQACARYGWTEIISWLLKSASTRVSSLSSLSAFNTAMRFSHVETAIVLATFSEFDWSFLFQRLDHIIRDDLGRSIAWVEKLTPDVPDIVLKRILKIAISRNREDLALRVLENYSHQARDLLVAIFQDITFRLSIPRSPSDSEDDLSVETIEGQAEPSQSASHFNAKSIEAHTVNLEDLRYLLTFEPIALHERDFSFDQVIRLGEVNVEEITRAQRLAHKVHADLDTSDVLQSCFEYHGVSSLLYLAERSSADLPGTFRVIAYACRALGSYVVLGAAALALKEIGVTQAGLWDAVLGEKPHLPTRDGEPSGTGVSGTAWLLKKAILLVALSLGTTDVVDFLISSGFGPIVAGDVLYQRAKAINNPAIMQTILEAESKPDNTENETLQPDLPVEVGILGELNDTAKALLLAGARADIVLTDQLCGKYRIRPEELGGNSRADQILSQIAMFRGHVGLGSVLCSASYHGLSNDVTMLVEENEQPVNEPSGLFGSALCAASYRGHYKIVEYLLLRGADHTLRGPRGTPLQYALRDQDQLEIPLAYQVKDAGDNWEVVKLLRNYEQPESVSSPVEYMEMDDFWSEDGDDEEMEGDGDDDDNDQ
ncbi:hypothetical protein FH972_025742 [Carpinus fangiana]|uniref:Nephrocystin 3-like N-terminal domain-containing protein n=1 Tax=Carpinus fangiana TaxID=176857 RepID=A0A5N6L2B1_9ROSI|nr:hypothetical protein FH972_025742 [Carpinus fangiana]